MVSAMKKAEKFLEAGKLRQAINTVRHFKKAEEGSKRRRSRSRRRVKKGGFPSLKAFLQKRDRLIELAIVRSAGKWNEKGRRLSAKKRQANLDKAALKLVETSYEGKEPTSLSPKERAMAAEALAVRQGGQQRALELLRQLHKEELMPTAWGYNTLARLESSQGNQTAGDDAFAQCKKMASKPKRVCFRD